MKKTDPLAAAVSLARKAGAILLESSRGIIRTKGQPGDFVTRADYASERFLINEILKAFPGHAILSEETRSDIKNPAAHPHLWIVDPCDGTADFHFKVPFFAVSVAYAEFGEVVAGAAYDPVRREMFYAGAGRGSFCSGRRLAVSGKKDISGTLVDVGCPYKQDDYGRLAGIQKTVFRRGARLRNLGSAVLEACYVADNRLSMYVDYGPRPWDVAASTLIVEEAGGVVAILGGKTIFDAKGFVFGSKARAAVAKKAFCL